MLALIAGTVSYLHMHRLVELHGQPGWVATLTPLSVDGMIVAASTTLLVDSRSGRRGGFLPWALLVAASAASLAANVAVAEPSVTGRMIAAWPSFSLIAAYELLMRKVRRGAKTRIPERRSARASLSVTGTAATSASGPATTVRAATPQRRAAGREVRLDAWRWAQGNRAKTARCPRARTSPSSTAGMSGGADWSSAPDYPANLARRVGVEASWFRADMTYVLEA